MSDEQYAQVALVFEVGEIGGGLRVIGRSLTDTIERLEEMNAPADIIEALKVARRQCVHANADTGVWAEKLIKQLQA